MISSYEPDAWIRQDIQAALAAWLRPVRIRLGRREYRYLIDQSCSQRLTVTGATLPIFEAYRRDHPEAVPMLRVVAGGQRYPSTTGRALRHMRCLKRAFGVSHFDGVPIELVDEPSRLEVVSESWGTA